MFDENEDKERHFCYKRATCEVRKSTLHLNLPTSLSSTEEISRNAVGGDDDRGRDHDVGDDNGDDEDKHNDDGGDEDDHDDGDDDDDDHDDHDDHDGGNLEPQL